MSLFEPEVAYFLPDRAIGPFSAFVVIEEVATDDLEITQHPVETGAAITDHAFTKPATVTVKAVWGPDVAPLTETYARLLELRASRVPFTVVTGKRQYESMLMKSIQQTTDGPTENILAVSIELQEIVRVSVETATVPPAAQHADASKTAGVSRAGTKQAGAATGSQTTAVRSGLAALAGKGG